MTDKEFYNAIYQMRQAQEDFYKSNKNFNARQKARMYERKVDAEVAKRKELINNN